MFIKSLAAKNKAEGWELKEVTFDYNLTLLVGISGAGKTQILRTIDNLKKIAKGEVVEGFEWKVVIELQDGEYVWSGEFSVEKHDEGNAHEMEKRGKNYFYRYVPPEIVKETLKNRAEAQLIIERNKEGIFFEGVKMPRLAKDTSILDLFGEEAIVSQLVTFLKHIAYKDHTQRTAATYLSPLDVDLIIDLIGVHISVGDVKTLHYDNVLKYHLVEEAVKQQIDDAFMAVFEEVEEVGSAASSVLPDLFIKLQIKIKGSDNWIEQDKMSSGMLRYLLLLIDLYLSPDGAIFLIDEIENSLGINCLDEYVHQLQHANRNIQIIATSHHPYIINNIPYQQWKIIERKGKTITAKDAEEFSIGQSRQDSFIQLVRLFTQPVR